MIEVSNVKLPERRLKEFAQGRRAQSNQIKNGIRDELRSVNGPEGSWDR